MAIGERFGPTSAAARRQAGERPASLAQAFESWVEAAPGALAFKHGDLALSYREFDRAANRLAHAVLGTGIAPGERVALLALRPVNHAVAQMAALKAGLVCVPLDPALGEQRVEEVLSQCHVTLMLIDQGEGGDTQTLLAGRCRVLDVDALPAALPTRAPPCVATEETLAYLLYTSGSTGRPKGVMQNHRNLLHVARLYRTDLGLKPTDRLTNPTAHVNAATIWSLLAALTSGAAFVVSEVDSARRLAATLARERVTVLQAIVSLLREIMLDVDTPLDLPWLRLVYTGGETLHRADVTRFLQVFGESCRLMVDLGSTEASVVTHLAADEWIRRTPPSAAEGMLPCGRPVDSVEVVLVDEQGQPVGAGAVGEIVVRSPFLSPGYWSEPELTAQRFRSDPSDSTKRTFLTGDLGRWLADGTLVHLGRIDDQVKVSGHRVQLTEVEAAVREIPGVRLGAVVAVQDTRRDTRIAAFVTLAPDADLSAQDIRRRLAARLPNYMVPSTVSFVDRMPTTTTGKVDHAVLAAHWQRSTAGRPEPRSESDPLMRALAALWTEVLDVEPAALTDDFVELGGDSLRLMRLIARLEAIWGVEVTIATLLEHSTLEDMARLLEARMARGGPARRRQAGAPATSPRTRPETEQGPQSPDDRK